MTLIVIAHLPACHDGDCPTIFRDTEHPGMVGIKGATRPGAAEEHASWMTEADFRHLAGQLPA